MCSKSFPTRPNTSILFNCITKNEHVPEIREKKERLEDLKGFSSVKALRLSGNKYKESQIPGKAQSRQCLLLKQVLWASCYV